MSVSLSSWDRWAPVAFVLIIIMTVTVSAMLAVMHRGLYLIVVPIVVILIAFIAFSLAATKVPINK